MSLEEFVPVLAQAAGFLAIVLFVNVLLINRWRLTFRSQPGLYVVFYNVISVVLLLTVVVDWAAFADIATMLAIIGTGLLYTAFCHRFATNVTHEDGLRLLRIPATQGQILDKTWSCGVVKVSEILWQQVCALGIVLLLLDMGLTPGSAGVWFATVVLILHLPTLWLQGPICGSFFTLASSAGALIYPTLLTSGVAGLGTMVFLHTVAYICFFTYVQQRLSVQSISA